MGGFAAVVLTGGGGVRMGGLDKAGIEVAGVTLLERALHATWTAVEVVVVGAPGAEVPTTRPATWTTEDPPGGGPAAALLAGLDRLVGGPVVVVALAVDMPGVTAATVARLVTAAEAPWTAEERAEERGGDGTVDRADGTVDGARLVDTAGRAQPLAAAYRVDALLAARPDRREDEHGMPMHRLVSGMRMRDVPEIGAETRDVDTHEDLAALRLLHESPQGGTLDR